MYFISETGSMQSFSVFFSDYPLLLTGAVITIALLSPITVIQRLLYIHKAGSNGHLRSLQRRYRVNTEKAFEHQVIIGDKL
jgi:hypothetical protein